METLIINLGPPGDVLRTTVLLKELEGNIYWLSSKKCKDVLNSKKIKKTFFIEENESIEEIKKYFFDLIISLNEQKEALDFLEKLNYKKIIGVYKEGDKINYTPESSYWFDMSLISKLGKEKADKLKLKNKKSYPQILIEMIGKKWKGQEYDLGIDLEKSKEKEVKGRVGLINVVTGLWPNKGWVGYEQLAEKLKEDNYEVVFLGIRPSIKEHIEEIEKCELVVCGDTLGMHIALALKKKVVALFNCTSPTEIYDYGCLVKITSPLLKKYFYKKEYSIEAVKAIKIEEVYNAIKKLLKG